MDRRIDISSLRLIRDRVLVADMNFDAVTTQSGIIINSDNGKTEGIKPRWGRIVAVGPEQNDVKVGEWVLVAHGRWTRGIEANDLDGSPITVRFVDIPEMIMTADEQPQEEFGQLSGPDFSPSHRPEDFI